MGLQLLHVYKPPIRSVFYFFKVPTSYNVTGEFLRGLSFGAIPVGRGAPMLLIVLTYIALYQTALQEFFTILIYAAGFSIPLMVINSLGGALGKTIKDTARGGEDAFDRIIGVMIVLIVICFLYLAFG